MSGANTVDVEGIFSQDSLAAEIANLWSQWKSARVGVETRWKETTAYKYATSTNDTANEDVGGTLEGDKGWSHSTHVPKLTQVADNLSSNYMASILPHDAWFKYIGETQEESTKEKRKAIESYIRSKHRLNGFRNTTQKFIDDWIQYGNCFGSVSYTTMTHEGKSGYTGPVVGRISPLDIVFNLKATSFEDAPKIIRSMKTLGELKRDIEENHALGYSQEAFNKAKDMRNMLRQANADDFDKSVQITFDGFGSASQYLTSGFVEILEFYGDFYDVSNDKFLKNHVITVIDRAFVIRSAPLDTVTGRPHIFHCGWRLRNDNLWAMGPLDNLIGMQYLINHLENARADMFDQMVAPTRVEVGDVESNGVETGRPGGTYRIPAGEGSVTNLLPDTTVLNADLQIARKEQQMEEFSGAPKEQLGIRTPGEKTLGEVTMLSAAASRTFQNKINYFEENFLEKIINAELMVAITNLDGKDTIKVIDDETGTAEFLDITSDDILTTGKLIPIGARHFSRMNQLAGQLQSLELAIQQDPLMAEHFPSKKKAELWAELLQLDKFDLITPYGRVSERAELSRLTQAAETQVEAEQAVDVGGEEEELEEVI